MDLVQQFAEVFSGRFDCYAEGYPHPTKPNKYSYATRKEPLTPEVLQAHLDGSRRLGIYPLVDNFVRWFAIDFDCPKDDEGQPVADGFSRAWAEAEAQAAKLEQAGLFVYLERSRSMHGVHLWGFFDEPVEAATVLRALRPLMLDAATFDRIYPVQSQVDAGGYGNLIALPFQGESWPTGGTAFLNRETLEPIALDAFLAGIERNFRAVVEELAERAPKERPKASRQLQTVDGDTVLTFEGRPERPISGFLKLISPFGCKFMHHAWVDRKKLSQPEWWVAVGQCTVFEHGRDAAHLLSQDYPDYSPEETDKLYDRLSQHPPHGCAYIHAHFPEHACTGCPMKAPYHVAKKSILELGKSTVEPLEQQDWGGAVKRVRRRHEGTEDTGDLWHTAGLDQFSRLRRGELTVIGARPSVGKCVHGDTPIMDAATGELLTVRQFVEEKREWVVSLTPDNRQVKARVAAHVADGTKPVVRLTTQNGSTVVGTYVHPVLTPTGWTPLGELRPGDAVAVPRRLPHAGGEALPDAEVVVLACMLADGCYSKRTYAKTDPTLVAEFTRAVTSLGWSVSRAAVSDKHPRSPQYYVKTGRSQPHAMAALLEKHGLTGLAHEKRIPTAIWRVPLTQLARFIGLLWSGDGWVGRGHAQFGVASEQLARDVRHALLRLGISSTLGFKANAGRGAWTVNISNIEALREFVQQVPLYGVRAEQASRIAWGHESRRQRGNIRVEAYPEVAQRCRTLARGTGLRVARGGTIRMSAVSRLDHPEAQWLASPDVVWETVRAVEAAGEAEVYDLCVPGNENFVAGDFYVHNTALLVDFAFNQAIHGAHVFVFSAETNKSAMQDRFLSRASGVDSKLLRNEGFRTLRDDEWEAIADAAGRLEGMPIYVNYSAISPDQVFDLIERTILTRRIPLTAKMRFAFDYLQCSTSFETNSFERPHERVARASSSFKLIAKILDLPAIVLSQLTREAEGDEAPSLAAFSDSGQIERDADIAIVLAGERIPGPVAPRDLWLVKQKEGDAGVKIQTILHQTISCFEPRQAAVKTVGDLFADQPDAF